MIEVFSGVKRLNAVLPSGCNQLHPKLVITVVALHTAALGHPYQGVTAVPPGNGHCGHGTVRLRCLNLP